LFFRGNIYIYATINTKSLEMKRILILLCIMSAICTGFGNLEAQTSWNYPVKPGTPEWEAL
jgi:hypothetical protein